MTKTTKKSLATLTVILSAMLRFSGEANSAILMPAMLGGQVQQFSESGKVNGCGVTLFGVEEPQVGRVTVFNGSVVLFNAGSFDKGACI